MSVLKGLTQEEIERERYEARERARRDALSWRKALERREAEAAEALDRGRAEGRAEGLIGQVRLCERFLKRTPLSDEQLNSMSVGDLKQLLEELESQLPT